MKKKVVALLLACSMAVMMAGCGAEGSNNDKNANTETATQTEKTDNNSGTEQMISYKVEDYVTIGDYSNLAITLDSSYEVTDADVVENINQMLAYYPEYEDTDKTTVENGDFVDIDYEGKKDGVAFDGGTAQGYVLEIGSHSFIDGFEEGLVGAKVGETLDLDLTFPEEYHSAELAGAAVVFTVKVNKIVEKVNLTVDDLTDAYVKEKFYSDTVDAFKEQTKSELQREADSNKEAAIRQKVLEQLDSLSTVTLPEGLLEQKVDQWIQQFENQCKANNQELETYLATVYGMTVEQFETQITTEMESSLHNELVLEALTNKEGAKLDEAAFEKNMTDMANVSGFQSVDELYAMYDNTYCDGKTYLSQNFLYNSTLDKLVENCEITVAE